MCEDALEHCFSEPRSALLIAQPLNFQCIYVAEIHRLSKRDRPSRHRKADLVQFTTYSTVRLYEERHSADIMTGRGGGGGGRGKVLLPPINFIFKLLQQRSTVSIWLYEQLAIRIEGKIRVS